MRLSVSSPKGALPSNAWRTMPSSRSPRVMSWYSARAFRTRRGRFSVRTPVWTRSMLSFGGVSLDMGSRFLLHGQRFEDEAGSWRIHLGQRDEVEPPPPRDFCNV